MYPRLTIAETYPETRQNVMGARGQSRSRVAINPRFDFVAVLVERGYESTGAYRERNIRPSKKGIPMSSVFHPSRINFFGA